MIVSAYAAKRKLDGIHGYNPENEKGKGMIQNEKLS